MWIAYKDYYEYKNELDSYKRKYKDKRFVILPTKDLKSYKKLIPSLKIFPNNVIITADDDVIYSSDWLRKLVNGYKSHPDCIICHRAHRIQLDGNNNILPYRYWIHEYNISSSSFLNFFTGVGGVLYPPHCFKKIVFDEESFASLCPNADDVWFWANAVSNGKKVHIIENPCIDQNFILNLQEDKECPPLWKLNYKKNMNDLYLYNVIKKFKPISLKLRMKIRNEYKFFKS